MCLCFLILTLTDREDFKRKNQNSEQAVRGEQPNRTENGMAVGCGEKRMVDCSERFPLGCLVASWLWYYQVSDV